MAFSFLRKNKENELPLPPPPLPPLMRGDIAPIRAPLSIPSPPALPLLPVPMETHEEHEMNLPELPPSRSYEEPAPVQPMQLPVFDKPRRKEEPMTRSIPAKSFVAVEDYRSIMNDTNAIRTKLMDAENFVKRLTDLKNEEERALDKWRAHLEDVEKKLTYVDHVIEKAQR